MCAARLPRGASFADSTIASLGHDWQKIGGTTLPPRLPHKVYLPQSVEDVIRAVDEARALGQKLVIRGGAHSSNNLVTAQGGAVLCTGLLDRILRVDVGERFVVVEAGATLARIDEHLRPLGFGLPVVADAASITVGGIASVGGISPASHRFGMFVDCIDAIEIVDWGGNRKTFSRRSDPAGLNRVLGGTGRHGVIVQLTLDMIPGDKWTTITRNERQLMRSLDWFLSVSRQYMMQPEQPLMQRALWLEHPTPLRLLRIGQCTAYQPTQPSAWKTWRERATFAVLHFFGDIAGRLPRPLGRMANMVGSVSFIFSPRYASLKNIETFTEEVFDVSVGDPVRWLAVITPLDAYEVMFRELHAISTRYRDELKCFSTIAIYVVGVRSGWLAMGSDTAYCDLLLHLVVTPRGLAGHELERLVGEVDEVCMRHGGFRYQHSLTSTAPDIRRRVDANERYCRAE